MNHFAPRSLFGFACTLVLPLIAAAACSSSDSDDVSADQAATDASNALCTALEKCVPFLLALGYGDANTCKTRSKLGLEPALTANGTSLTPSQLAACARDLGGATCEQVTSRNIPESCRIKPGSLTDGTACSADQQCQNRLCRKDADKSCGACSKLGAAGEACKINDECDFGMACGLNGVCVRFGAAGDACDNNRPCTPTLTCKSGTCGTPAEAGEPCDPPGPQSNCNGAKGLYCGANKVCAQVQFAGAGQACGVVEGRFVGCSGAGSCQPLPTGTCKAPAADGSACDDAKGPGCSAPARCIGGVCKLDDPNACK